mmetsp:Transcript_65619/g.165337  ORF Transcript_65619/g.165337 Transcript_65619/m.165337 type:complete len:257 (+) Transcript_65619:376-1146(+)
MTLGSSFKSRKGIKLWKVQDRRKSCPTEWPQRRRQHRRRWMNCGGSSWKQSSSDAPLCLKLRNKLGLRLELNFWRTGKSWMPCVSNSTTLREGVRKRTRSLKKQLAHGLRRRSFCRENSRISGSKSRKPMHVRLKPVELKHLPVPVLKRQRDKHYSENWRKSGSKLRKLRHGKLKKPIDLKRWLVPRLRLRGRRSCSRNWRTFASELRKLRHSKSRRLLEPKHYSIPRLKPKQQHRENVMSSGSRLRTRRSNMRTT